MTPNRYSQEAHNIIEWFKPRSILELGGGYGGLAEKILKISDKTTYTIVDNDIMLELAKETLGNRVRYIDANDVGSLTTERFDLLIANHCLSETPIEYREWVGMNIFPLCEKIFITDDTSVESLLKLSHCYTKEKYLDYKNLFIFKGSNPLHLVNALIHSGDKNAWVWKYWWYYYQKHWDFDRIQTTFITEVLRPTFNEHVTVKTTGTGQWSTELIKALEDISIKYVIYMHEDVFLTNKIQTEVIEKIILAMELNNLNLVKCSGRDAGWREAETRVTPTDIRIGNEILYLYPNDLDYLVSHQVSVWNTRFLASTLVPEETSWDHELKGTPRLRRRNVPLYAYCSEENEPNNRPIPHIEAIRRGKPRTQLAVEMMRKADEDGCSNMYIGLA